MFSNASSGRPIRGFWCGPCHLPCRSPGIRVSVGTQAPELWSDGSTLFYHMNVLCVRCCEWFWSWWLWFQISVHSGQSFAWNFSWFSYCCICFSGHDQGVSINSKKHIRHGPSRHFQRKAECIPQNTSHPNIRNCLSYFAWMLRSVSSWKQLSWFPVHCPKSTQPHVSAHTPAWEAKGLGIYRVDPWAWRVLFAHTTHVVTQTR
jgi:hypothetical protein